MNAILLILAAALAAGPTGGSDATLQVKNDVDNSRLIFTIGPVEIPCGDHSAIHQPKTQAITIPIDGFLQGFTVELVDENGVKLPDVLLHHVNIIAPERRELFSPIMQRVGAAGAETGPLQLPWLLGYPVSRGDSLVFTVMFHNPTDEDYHGVELRVLMKYSGPVSLLPKLAIQPFYIDVMPPAGYHAYSLPPGKSSKSWEGSPAIPGRVLGLGGHMHKYGVALRFEDVTSGKVLWESRPVTDSTGNVVEMPRKFFLWRLGLHLDPRHTYRLTAEYDNPTGEVIEDGAMGTLGGVFVPDERAIWPKVDRSDPQYIADVKVTYARNEPGGMGGMHMHHH